jgi:general secretion pathway protein A
LNAIRRGEHLNVLTGDIGTGKTTLCRAVLDSLDRRTFSAFVSDPRVSRRDLLKMLLIEFGVVSADEVTGGRLRTASRTELRYRLSEFLGTLAALHAFAVVFIDEAQYLSPSLLEETRILSDADSPLQIVLVGQLELREKLKRPEMRQLDQRVSVHGQISPLDPACVADYIAHRLRQAGGSADRVRFSADAVDGIFELSAGVPRLVNRLCDRALRAGSIWRAATIDWTIVQAANLPALADPAAAILAPALEFERVVSEQHRLERGQEQLSALEPALQAQESFPTPPGRAWRPWRRLTRPLRRARRALIAAVLVLIAATLAVAT